MSSVESGHSRYKKCDHCGKEDALVFFKIIKQNSIEQKGLCARCALKYLENNTEEFNINHIDEKMMESLNQVRDLVNYIIGGIEAIARNQSKSENETTCPYCGSTLKNFLDSGYLGCPYCFEIFRKEIKDYIIEFERDTIHKGKMPHKFATLYLMKKEISYLRNRLKKLLLSEKYEEAERIKRKLEKLIGSYPINHEDELY